MTQKRRTSSAKPRAPAPPRDGVLRAPRRAAPRRRRKRSSRRARRPVARFLQFAAEGAFYLFAIAIAAAAVITHFARDLPSTDSLWASDAGPRIVMLDAEGRPMRVHGESRGAPVRLADLPAHTPSAILAVEDRNFYHHIGINPISVARALIVNASEGEVRQGGSTLTQQLAKNLFLSPERTYKRKIQELLLALWLEHRFTKDEILTLYLNRVYFGAGAYGVDAASWRYFGKPSSKLTLAESAILAGVLKAPSHYAPDRNPHDAGARGRLVVDAMLDAGFVTRAAAERAYAAKVSLEPSRFGAAPWFVDYAQRAARAHADGVDADLVIRTTFDPALQDALETGVAAGSALAALSPDIEVAGVILDSAGAVRAMIGGRDYAASQFNRAADARRQPGSAFKPFVFLAALENGADPQDRLLDEPIAIGRWRPENYKGRYYGDVSMAFALEQSLNAASVRLQEATGRSAVRRTARRMGWEGPLSEGAALALGVDALSPLALAGAYAPLANGGYRVRPHGVARIDLGDGGAVWRAPEQFVDIAAAPEAVAALNGMLAGVIESGTGRAARLSNWRAHGKTGTTQDNRDAWFAGHAGGLVCVVWIGRDDNAPMAEAAAGEITGGAAPAVIWRETMERALRARAPARSVPLAAGAIGAG